MKLLELLRNYDFPLSLEEKVMRMVYNILTCIRARKLRSLQLFDKLSNAHCDFGKHQLVLSPVTY